MIYPYNSEILNFITCKLIVTSVILSIDIRYTLEYFTNKSHGYISRTISLYSEHV